MQLEHLECGRMKGGICHPIIPSRGKIVGIIFGDENKRALMNLDLFALKRELVWILLSRPRIAKKIHENTSACLDEIPTFL